MYFPEDNIIIKGLNSYYIDVRKLVEHFTGQIGSGVVSFKGPHSKGTIFFDEEHFVDSCFKKGNELEKTGATFDLIIKYCEENNYEIDIYYIEPEFVYLWSETAKAQEADSSIYKELKSFDDACQLFKTKKLTGYIRLFNGKDESGAFFAHGQNFGSLKNGKVKLSYGGTDFRDESDIAEIKDLSMKIYITGIENTPVVKESEPETVASIQQDSSFQSEELEFIDEVSGPSQKAITAMGQFIGIVEGFINQHKKIKVEFLPLLKKKFVFYVDKYDFLDPFAAELIYSEGKIEFFGSASEKDFIDSLMKCSLEIMGDLGIKSVIKPFYTKWFQRYGDLLKKNGVANPF